MKKYHIFSGDLDTDVEEETYRHAILKALRDTEKEVDFLGELIQITWEGCNVPHFVGTKDFLISEGLWENSFDNY